MSKLSGMRQNVRDICELEEEALRRRSQSERLGDFVAFQSGRMWFIIFHAFWFSLWIVFNWTQGSKHRPFDPFPYPLLTMIVSLESIFLSLFILVSQNRSARQADVRAHLDLQINLLAEHESTKTLQLLQALCKHHGLNCATDPEIKELVSKTNPSEIVEELKSGLPNETDSQPR
jgi:uncharacterized membrane protein